MSSSIKPSGEANFTPKNADFQLPSHIDICGIAFAKFRELKSSLNKAHQNTDIYTISRRPSNIEKIIKLPKLISTDRDFWHNSAMELLLLTDISVVFLPHPPSAPATIVCVDY
ncbi:hypothetical protein EPUL_005797 [Erysiphe pulchra]|uniref:Uncharacterized protein n=1 Tax=Erysiphe pulchra TaxID=225359 RepID=A0A2S4PMA8_9PEZI|nr:hypothetical protein EPUL_005797 [Erysiphe pulchra]